MDRIGQYIARMQDEAELPPNSDHAEEIKSHLEDMTSELERQGFGPEEAVEHAIRQFGTPQVVGRRLREVTPLRISRRDWLLLGAGALTTVILTLMLPSSRILVDMSPSFRGFDWLAPAFVVGVAGAVLAKRPIFGSLSGVAGLLLLKMIMEMGLFLGRPGLPISGSFRLLPIIEWLPASMVHQWRNLAFFEWAILAVVGTAVGLFVTKLRHRSGDLEFHGLQVAAGIAELTPFLILGGLRWGAVGIMADVVLWWRAKEHSPFLARHALQGLVVGVCAIMSQVTFYQLWIYSGNGRWHPYSALALTYLAIQVVRRFFGTMAVWAAMSAFAGHDFRYPFAGLLFGKALNPLRQ